MNRHCTQCKSFVQHYFINECMRLSDIYKRGHCKKGFIKDGRLKICKDWSLSDKTGEKRKQALTLEGVLKVINSQLNELLLVYTALVKEQNITPQ